MLFLTACGGASPASGNLTFTDGLGREVKLDGPAQRVVSLAPSNTEILFAIGAGSQVVGRDEFSDYPEKAKALSSVGGSFGEYSIEAIVALEPNLVLAAEINTPELVKQLEDLGLTVYYLKNPVTLEEMYVNLETWWTRSRHASRLWMKRLLWQAHTRLSFTRSTPRMHPSRIPMVPVPLEIY
jgi:iron complex transport system substrate-binding protein